MNDPIQPSRLGTLWPMARDRKKSLIALMMALGLTASACAGDPETSAQAVDETTTSAQTSDSAEPEAEPGTTIAAPTAVDPTTAAPTTGAPTTAAPAPVAFDLPNVDLTNIKTGSTMNLTSVADGKPLVLWFWAPH